MMDKSYKITNVQARNDWESSYGPMKAFALQLTGVEGWVSINQVPKTPAPQVGDELFGHLEPSRSADGTKTYMKFKKQKNPNYSGGGGGSSTNQKDIDYMIMMLEELTLRRQSPDTPTPRNDVLPTDEDMTKEFTLDMIPDFKDEDKQEIPLSEIPF